MRCAGLCAALDMLPPFTSARDRYAPKTRWYCMTSLALLLQALAVLVVLACAPLLRGVINRLKAMLQSRRGPSIWQPYYDYWKLLHKGCVVSEHASWVYHLAPPLVFITPLAVATLIPVITAYPLPYAFMGDMLAGGFILSLGGFLTSIAALDTGSAFGGMGSSRARVVSLFAEPVVLLVLFTVTLIAKETPCHNEASTPQPTPAVRHCQRNQISHRRSASSTRWSALRRHSGAA